METRGSYKDNRRPYKDEDEIEVGDVVMWGAWAWAFDTAIVTKIEPTTYGWNNIHLERPHVKLEQIGCCQPTLAIMTERYSVPSYLFVQKYLVATSGDSGNKDNRLYSKNRRFLGVKVEIADSAFS